MEEFVRGLAENGLVDDAGSLQELLAEVGREAVLGVALSMPRVGCVSSPLLQLTEKPSAFPADYTVWMTCPSQPCW